MTAGTTNGGDRGNTRNRRSRKQWLVETFRANQDVVHIWDVENGAQPDGPPTWISHSTNGPDLVRLQERWGRVAIAFPACRCYRCGKLLTVETVTPDRITPGCVKTAEYPDGGTYVRKNLRPSCLPCQYVTGNQIKHSRKGKRR